MKYKTPIEILLRRLESDNSLTLMERCKEAHSYHESLSHAHKSNIAMVALFALGALAAYGNRDGLTGLFFLAGAGAGCYAYSARKSNQETIAFLEAKYGDHPQPPTNE